MFDINTAIGHWPFRRLPVRSAADLLVVLERHGIDGAAVAHTHGLFYKNCHDANLELAEELTPFAGRLFAVATLNPCYAAWEKDLHECVESLGCRALRLAPQYHDYALADERCLALVRAAAALGLPLFIPHRVVDPRQRHWRDTERVNAFSEVLALARAVPEAVLVLTEFVVGPSAFPPAEEIRSAGNLYVEMSRLRSAYGQELAALAQRLGSHRLLFGSGAPFKEISPALLKLQCADVDEAARERIADTNARELLGIRADA